MVVKHLLLLFLLLRLTGLNGQNPEQGFANLQVAWQLITNFHVDHVNREELAREAIQAMLNKLDPHSVFIPAYRVKAMSEALDGNFEGVGIEFGILNDTLVVLSTVPGGPACQAGLLAGDRIIAIDGNNIASAGITNSMVTSMLRGQKGTRVNVKVWRRQTVSEMMFDITRERIPIQSVEAAYMVTPHTGYIKVSRFAANTHNEFSTALSKLKGKGMENLVLDLRGNGGGYLKAALDITDEFLDRGQLMLYTEGAALARREHQASSGGAWHRGELVILMDGNSASASEIVAGAVQDWDRGIVVGHRSYGKGLVQRPFNLPDGSEIRLTIANYFTPSGRNIQRPFNTGGATATPEQATSSTQVNQDSSWFRTLRSERPVQGGGGIVPDIIVPSDGSQYPQYYMNLVRAGVLNRVVMRFMDNYRLKLQNDYPSFTSFVQNFRVSDDLLNQVAREGELSGVILDATGLENSGDFINTHVKALIARDLWTSNEFFQVINPLTRAFTKSIEIIENSRLVSEILR